MIQVGVLALVMARSFPKHRKHLPVVSQECTQAWLTGFSATLLERVMNFSSGTIASRHGYAKTIPKRRFRRGVGIPGSVPRARPGRRTPTRVRSARGLQRTEVDRTHRLCVEIHAPRPASVGDDLPTDAAVAQSGRLRGDSPRSARAFAAFGRPGVGPDGGHARLTHSEIHPGERASERLRR